TVFLSSVSQNAQPGRPGRASDPCGRRMPRGRRCRQCPAAHWPRLSSALCRPQYLLQRAHGLPAANKGAVTAVQGPPQADRRIVLAHVLGKPGAARVSALAPPSALYLNGNAAGGPCKVEPPIRQSGGGEPRAN